MTSESSPPVSLSLEVPADSLRPLLEVVVAEIGHFQGWPPNKIALEEEEAAKCIGVKKHVLRDARRCLKLSHTLVGRSIVYTREQLQKALDRMTVNP